MLYPFFLLLILTSTVDLSRQDVIDNLLMSLSKGITYFEKQGRNINLDGVVGYIILEGDFFRNTQRRSKIHKMRFSDNGLLVKSTEYLFFRIYYSPSFDVFHGAAQTDWRMTSKYRESDSKAGFSRGALMSYTDRSSQHHMIGAFVCSYTAQLLEATRTWPHSDFLSLSQRSAAVSLVKRLNRSLSAAVSALQDTDAKYFKEFEPILDSSFWSLPAEWSLTDPSLVYSSVRSMECYDEHLSDKCMTLLLGTWKDNGTPCIVTKSCRDAMTQFGCPHYSLSHQLLYFMIGTMKGCSRMLKGDMRLSRVNITVEHYKRIFCSNMIQSNQDMFRNGLTGQMQDIFLENILLCGLEGFSDFYKLDWLQSIITWQDQEVGCFGKEDDLAQIFEEFLDAPHKRVKRREKTLNDGCSSHMTGVAVSALGGFLNYYLSEQDITKRPLI